MKPASETIHKTSTNCKIDRSKSEADERVVAPVCDTDKIEERDDPEEEVVELQPEEVEKLQPARSPIRPSAAEIEEHRLTHLPFRAWCGECVAGRGTGEKHTMKDQED